VNIAPPIRLALLGVPLAMTLTSTTHAQPAKTIKVGIIGLDTSHVSAFTKAMNDKDATGDLSAVEVVAAYPGGSPDIPASRDRVEGYTKELRDAGVEIVGSIDELLTKVDAVMLESVDGRPHLQQAIPVIKARKPLFIDKPVAGTLADAVAIYKLAEEHKVPCFSSSSLRFSPGILGMRHDERVGEVLGCDAFGPCALEEHHPRPVAEGLGHEELLTPTTLSESGTSENPIRSQ
jgi:predicted dehydrogenase